MKLDTKFCYKYVATRNICKAIIACRNQSRERIKFYFDDHSTPLHKRSRQSICEEISICRRLGKSCEALSGRGSVWLYPGRDITIKANVDSGHRIPMRCQQPARFFIFSFRQRTRALSATHFETIFFPPRDFFFFRGNFCFCQRGKTKFDSVQRKTVKTL